MVKNHGYCTVVVSEGVKGQDGKFLSDQGLRDAFGHAQLGGVAPVIASLVKERLGLKYHWAWPTICSVRRAISPRRRMCCRPMQRRQGRGGSWRSRDAIRSCRPSSAVSNRPYKLEGEYGAELKDVANKEKFMPRDFITKDGFGITDKCRCTWRR
jgi:hypothetical protein